MDLLRDLAIQGHDLAEVEDLGAIDRLVALAHHVHEDLGRAEHAADRGRGVAEGGVAVVAAEGLDLGLDDVADRRAVGRRNVLGERRDSEAGFIRVRPSSPDPFCKAVRPCARSSTG